MRGRCLPATRCPWPRRAAWRSPRRASPSRRPRGAPTGGRCAACSIASASSRSTPSTCSSRAHYLPLFSRGSAPYDRDAARPRRAYRAPRRLFEYWGHEASLLPVELQPLLRWRMAARARRGLGRHAPRRRGAARARRAGAGRGPRPRPADRARAEAERRARSGPGPWWDWTRRQARARVAVLERRGHLRAPARLRAALRRARAGAAGASPRRADARRRTRPSARCCSGAARALGVATERDLRDYFRLPAGRAPGARRRARRGGRAAPGDGRGLAQPAYLHPEARLPRRSRRARCSARSTRWSGSAPAPSGCSASATGSRSTCPRPKRVHGYYVLPFLLGDRLVARVDLKADRQAGVLRVQAAHAEPARRRRRRRRSRGARGARRLARPRPGWRSRRAATSRSELRRGQGVRPSGQGIGAGTIGSSSQPARE